MLRHRSILPLPASRERQKTKMQDVINTENSGRADGPGAEYMAYMEGIYSVNRNNWHFGVIVEEEKTEYLT